ncbi:P97 family adhesin [Mesomycoplasma ovipneumoniae]|uniref:P97 family adhesin n=1 Tax=Mesomycoplasma ovipneumoniae TaxID=29562 RepID=UPI00311AC9A2
MQKKKAKILIGSAAAIVLMSTVFGTVAGLVAKTKYRGVNPTQGVVSQLALIDSVSFKPTIAHFTSDYKTVKQALLGDKTFSAQSSEFSDFASKFNFLTNNGRSVLAIPNKYKVVIEKFEAQDEHQRFFLSFHLEETLEDKNVARSATKSIFLSVVDAPKAALAQFSDIVDSNFANLVPSPLSHFSSSSVKPLSLTRADDFAKILNQFETLEEFESHLSKFFDIQAIKAKIRLEAQGFGFAKGDLEEPFVFSFVKNPQNQNEWATSLNQQVPAVRLYLKTEFGPQAKATLANYKNKDESFLTSIDLVASDKSTLFANTKDLAAQLDVNLLDASDYYIDPDKPQVDPSTGVLLPSQLSLFDRDLLRQPSNKPVDKFSLFRYDAINFYKQLQELVSKPSAIKDIIDASLTRGLTFSFGKYDLLFDNLREHLDYDFLVSNAKIRQNSLSQKLFIELPIKIKLKSSIFGDTGQNIKTILEKTVSFKLDNFRDQKIEDALSSLYPELSEQLKQLKDAQSTQEAAQQLAATSPIQSQWAGQTLGATKENPYDIVQGAPKSYLLSKYEIKQLIDQKDYKKLISLLADQNSYNIDFKLGSTLQSQNIQVPSETEIANLNATIDSAQSLKNADIYSVSTSAFKNRASLFAYFRYLLSSEPKEAIKKLVNIGSQMGLEFEGYQDLPLNPTLADLAKVKIKTKFDNYVHDQDFLSEQDAEENLDGSVGTKFGLKLLDFNGYFANDITSPNQGMALFLPASLDSSSVQSTSAGSGTSSTQTTDWKAEITKKLVSDKNQLAQLPFAIWDKIIGQEKAQDNSQKLTYKILKNYQEAIKIAKQPAFWNTLDSDTNSSQVPFKDQNFSKIATLSDLVFAFYTQAALANNWNEYQDSGARPSIKFEIEEDAAASKDQGNIIGLKIKYVVGFDDNAGKFVDDVISSSPQTIFVRTSGQSEAEVKQKNNLDQMIEDAPLSSQSLILDAEKFGHLQILANSIYDKNKPAPEPETPRNPDNIRWIDDKVPGKPRPEVKRPEINQDEFFKDKLKPVSVPVSTFTSLDESPYFATPFQDNSQTSQSSESSQTSNEDLQTLKQKLEILLGQQFSDYFNKLDPNISFEIDSVKEVSPNAYSVSLSLVKNLIDGNTTTRVKSDKSLSLIVHKQQTNIPELAKTPEVSNTSWAKQYNPDQPLANSTTITLEFKNPIQTDASGQPTSQWLSSVPVTIHPALINISPQADVLDEAIANEILSRLETTSLIETPTPEALSQAFQKKQLSEIIKGLRGKVPESVSKLISPIVDAYKRHETTKTHILSLAHIQNSNHSPIKLSLNSLTNTNSEVKVANLQLINNNTLKFDLESSNIKRLINAPIEIASELSDKKFDLESMIVHNILSQDNSESNTHTHTHTHSQREQQSSKQNSTITFIKPKFIVERTVGVPWSTSQVVFAAKKNLHDPTNFDVSKVKDSTFFVYGWRAISLNTGSQPPVQVPYLQVQPLFDPLVDMFPVPQVQSLTSLSFKVFDPDGYLYQKLYSKSATNVDLYSYRLNQTKEQSTRKGWTNQHPSQLGGFANNNFSLPNNYLNIITNQPTKVTFYNASDFITDLFNDPDQKQEDINDKYTDNVKEKVGANAADWGSAYFNLWYPRKLIQEQSNIISANLNDLLFVDPDELQKNIKMIAPNFTNWWPNFQNSEVAEIRTKHNEEAFKKVNLLPQGWTQIHDGGYPLKVQKTAFNRDTRTFTLTTNLPIPTQDYYQDVKDTDDWRFVFQNDNNQIAMLKANMLKAGSKNPHYKDKGWIQFETVIPEHFFSTNVRFAGIFKQEDKKLKWLPIIDTEYVVDDRYFGNIISDPLDLKKARGRGFTNNAFGDVFKEFNIHRKKQS